MRPGVTAARKRTRKRFNAKRRVNAALSSAYTSRAPGLRGPIAGMSSGLRRRLGHSKHA